jgi:hypothetical protein
MENSELTKNPDLPNILNEVKTLYINSKESKSLDQKQKNYQKSTLLINKGKEQIENLKKEIADLDTSQCTPNQILEADKLIELLNAPNLNFKEVMHIVKQLKGIVSGIPLTSRVSDNIQEHAIYEEEDVESFE